MCPEFVKIKCCDHYRENMRSDTHTQTHHTRDSKLSTAVACPLILDENTSNAALIRLPCIGSDTSNKRLLAATKIFLI